MKDISTPEATKSRALARSPQCESQNAGTALMAAGNRQHFGYFGFSLFHIG
jgi:hypothetical protein